MADVLEHIYVYIYSGRCIPADTLQRIYCVPQKQSYLDESPAPEALDCCVQTCVLRPIAPKTPREPLDIQRPPKSNECLRDPTMEKKKNAIVPRGLLAFIYIIYIYIYIRICIYLGRSRKPAKSNYFFMGTQLCDTANMSAV